MGRLDRCIVALLLLLPLSATARVAFDEPGVEALPPALQSAGGETEKKPEGEGEEQEEPDCD